MMTYHEVLIVLAQRLGIVDELILLLPLIHLRIGAGNPRADLDDALRRPLPDAVRLALGEIVAVQVQRIDHGDHALL